jgi:hypothetical protein
LLYYVGLKVANNAANDLTPVKKIYGKKYQIDGRSSTFHFQNLVLVSLRNSYSLEELQLRLEDVPQKIEGYRVFG